MFKITTPFQLFMMQKDREENFDLLIERFKRAKNNGKNIHMPQVQREIFDSVGIELDSLTDAERERLSKEVFN